MAFEEANPAQGSTRTGQQVQDRRTEIAQGLGVRPNDIKTIRMELNELRQRGAFIQVRITGIGKLRTTASHIELGIPSTDLRAIRIKPGRKNLIPERYVSALQACDGNIRGALWNFSQKIEPISNYRYMRPYQFEQWQLVHQRHCDALEHAKHDILDNWDEIMGDMAQDWARVAQEAWQAIWGRWDWARQNQSDDLPILEAVIGRGREAFISDIMDQMRNAMPAPQDIRAIRAEWWSAMVEDTRDIEQAIAEAQSSRLERQEREALIRMRQQEAVQARDYLENAASPIMQAVIKLEQDIYEAVEHIANQIAKKGTIHPKQVKQLEALKETYNLTRIRDNDDLIAAFDALTQAQHAEPGEVNGKKPRYDADAIAEALRQISEAVIPEARSTDDSLIGALEI